jgi:hypothetical protein
MGQFLGQKAYTFCQFLVPIEFSRILAIRKRKNNLIIIWIIYDFNRKKKNPSEQKLAHFKVFWAQKLTLWMRDNITNMNKPKILTILLKFLSSFFY